MKKNYNKWYILPLAFFAVQTINAQEVNNSVVNTKEVNVLDEIVVSDNKNKSPLQLSVFNTEISKKKNHDAGSLFSGIPGFGIDKKGGYAMDPVFRGFKYEQLNIQFDGGTTVAPACPNRMDPVTTHITPEEVEKIEIIKGPYSVRYGSALGGVVNLVTKAPVYDISKIYKGSIEGGYETNGGNVFTSVKAGVVMKDWYFMADGGIKRFGNYESGSGQEIMSSFETNDYALKGGYSIDENQSVRLSFRQSFGRDIMHPGLPMDTDLDNSTIATLDYNYRVENSIIRNLKSKVYYASVDHVMSNKYRPTVAMMGISTSTTYSQTYGGKLELELGKNDKNIFYVGLDLKNINNQGDNVKVKGDVQSTKKVWQDSYVNDLGFFAQYNFNSQERFSLQTGVRADYINSDLRDPAASFEMLNPDGVHPDDELNLSVNLSGIYMLSDKWNTKLSVGRGVQTASVQHRYVNSLPVGRDNFSYVGNPLLNPESNHQADLSLNYFNKRMSFGINGYYSNVSNYITSVVIMQPKTVIMPNGNKMMMPGVKKFVNIDKAEIYGAEFNFAYEIVENLKFETSGFYTHAQNVDLNEALAEIPPMEANFSLMYDNNKWYSKINQRLVNEQNRVSPSAGESESPGFGVLDIFGGYEVNKHLRLDASVTNIFNLNYYEHLSRPYKKMDTQSEFYNMGRNFMLSAKISL